MSKIYQPIVIEKTAEIMQILFETNFFEESNLDNSEFANTYFLDKLTDKFIMGKINLPYYELFTDEEFDICMNEIIIGSTLEKLKKNGFINSYEDDSTEEIFFLTEEGKRFLENLKKNDNLL